MILIALIDSLMDLDRGVPATLPVCGIALKDITLRDMITLASGLSHLLEYELGEEDAMNKWFLEYRCMRELEEKISTLRAMLEKEGSRLLADQQKWVKVKVRARDKRSDSKCNHVLEGGGFLVPPLTTFHCSLRSSPLPALVAVPVRRTVILR